MTGKDILLALVAPLAWGAAAPISKPALEHFPPMLMMAFIYLIAAVTLLSFAGWPRTPHRRLIPIALLAGSVQAAMLCSGLAALPASTAMIAVQSQAPFAVIAAWILWRELPDRLTVLGIAVALCGIVIVSGAPELPPSPWPILLVIGSSAFWATGQTMIGRFSQDNGAVLTGGLAMHACWQLVIASAVLEQDQWTVITTASPLQWGQVVVVALLGFVLAYAVWYSLLRRLRVDQIVPFSLLTPVASIAIAAMTLGERPSIQTLAGAAVVLAGLAAIVWPRRALPALA